VTAQRILDAAPSVIQVVPLTKTIRGFASEVRIEPDAVNGLDAVSAAQCQHIRAVSTARADSVRGNVGALHLSQIRELLGTLLDIAA
jgi:mRNA interferase MazF